MHGLSERVLEARKGKVSSSRAAAIVGLDPYKDAFGAWLDITGRDEFEGNRATRRGNYLERPVMEMVADDLGMKFQKARMRSHPKFDWAVDNLDFILMDDKKKWLHGAEVKTVNARVAQRWGEEQTDEVPPNVIVQCQFHLAFYPELDTIVCPMFGGFDLDTKLFWVKRDETLIERLFGRLEEFYVNHVVTDLPPEPEGAEAKKRYLDMLYPTQKGVVAEADPELVELVLDRQKASAELAGAKKRYDELNNQIREKVGEAEVVEGHGVRIKRSYVKESQSMVTRKAHWRMSVKLTEVDAA